MGGGPGSPAEGAHVSERDSAGRKYLSLSASPSLLAQGATLNKLQLSPIESRAFVCSEDVEPGGEASVLMRFRQACADSDGSDKPCTAQCETHCCG